MVGEVSQLQEEFQSYANQESKYPAVTLVGYVTEDPMVFHKIHQFLTEGVQENGTDACHSTCLHTSDIINYHRNMLQK